MNRVEPKVGSGVGDGHFSLLRKSVTEEGTFDRWLRRDGAWRGEYMYRGAEVRHGSVSSSHRQSVHALAWPSAQEGVRWRHAIEVVLGQWD